MKELSVKYVKLKSKVPTETENLETEKKLSELRKLEKTDGPVAGDT